MTSKQLIRNQARQYRQSLTTIDIAEKSKAIADLLFSNFDIKRDQTVHIYQPIKGSGEVDTQYIIDRLSDEQVVLQDDTANFVDGRFDYIVVPGLAFSPGGDRLGFGHGHYDRFLKGQPQAITIGLSYEATLFEELPQEPHDILMNYIITEKELYN